MGAISSAPLSLCGTNWFMRRTKATWSHLKRPSCSRKRGSPWLRSTQTRWQRINILWFNPLPLWRTREQPHREHSACGSRMGTRTALPRQLLQQCKQPHTSIFCTYTPKKKKTETSTHHTQARGDRIDQAVRPTPHATRTTSAWNKSHGLDQGSWSLGTHENHQYQDQSSSESPVLLTYQQSQGHSGMLFAISSPIPIFQIDFINIPSFLHAITHINILI